MKLKILQQSNRIAAQQQKSSRRICDRLKVSFSQLRFALNQQQTKSSHDNSRREAKLKPDLNLSIEVLALSGIIMV